MKKQYYISQNYKIIFTRIEIADNFLTRFQGLMGKRKLDNGEGLLLLKCSAIHTCFMRFSIDVVYLDSCFQVLGCETVKPWKMGSFIKGSCNILELPPGAGQQLKSGEAIVLTLRNIYNVTEEEGETNNARK